MSNMEDRERAVREEKYAEQAALAVKQMELRDARRVGQGEYLGDMMGAFGAFAGGPGRLLIAGSQLTITLCVGAMLVMVLSGYR